MFQGAVCCLLHTPLVMHMHQKVAVPFFSWCAFPPKYAVEILCQVLPFVKKVGAILILTLKDFCSSLKSYKQEAKDLEANLLRLGFAIIYRKHLFANGLKEETVVALRK